MKKIILLITLLFIVAITFSQPYLLRKELSKIFFGVNFPLTRFDVREKLNSSINLHEYKEYIVSNSDFDDSYRVKFKNHPSFSYTEKAIHKSLSIPFKKGIDKSDDISLSMWYKIEDVALCRNQLNELLKIFKPKSYKIVKLDEFEDHDIKKQKIGELYFIFSSLTSFNKNENCILLSYKYEIIDNPYKENTIYEIPNGKYYIINIFAMQDRIY